MGIEEMIKEIQRSGYKVIKITPGMKSNAERCEELELEGESGECFGCSCNVCIME